MAAGKSTASRRLRELGAFVLDADQAARAAVSPGSPGLGAVAGRFGPGLLRPDGSLDRPALAARVFGDAGELAALNGILHPLIQAALTRGLEEAARRGEAVAVLDVPLLFECGWQAMCDETWLVAAPEALRIARAMARDGMSEAAARARLTAQMPEAEKRALADVVLENDGPVEKLLRQVDAQFARLKEGAYEKGS